jgi:hypothetical protein
MAATSRLAPLLLALCAAACATRPVSDLDAFARQSANNSFEAFDRRIDPPSTLVLPVAHDRQTEGAACGAHVLASVMNYWLGAGAAVGDQIYRDTPPADAELGYSIAELVSLARQRGLLASGVRLGQADLIRELESGRPVVVPVRIPAIYVQSRTLPGANAPVIGVASAVVEQRVGRLSEWTDLAMVNHYVLVAGYEGDRFVVLEPVMGFRTISFERLARYRRSFGDAAVVVSAASRPAGAAPSGG